MCTMVILFRPGHDWPVLIAANRDEALDRPWDAPARHWPDRPEVIAGRDRLADGSWLGVNDHGVVAGILNRMGTLGPAPGKRSRGELVLEALDHADAADAVDALADLAGDSYRPFNMLIADNSMACWLRNDGARVTAHPIPPGLSMLTARDLNDPASPRVARHLADFRAAPVPDPDQGDWQSWIDLLRRPPLAQPEDGMTIITDGNFGTVCSSLIALPGPHRPREEMRLLFAPGRPDQIEYAPVTHGSGNAAEANPRNRLHSSDR